MPLEGDQGTEAEVGALSCVAQPVEELGRQMALTLLAHLAGDEGPRHLMLPVELHQRASSVGLA